MPQFDPLKYSFASHRNIVYAKKGMACSTSPIASQVGLDVLKSGGNAMDAAVAMATTLPLVEPTGNGLGSDCFALVWSEKDQKLFGLDGSGVAPMALSAEKVKEAGYTAVPMNGWLPTMVPGAPSAWAELRRRFGTKSMAELMAPAIQYARDGLHSRQRLQAVEGRGGPLYRRRGEGARGLWPLAEVLHQGRQDL